MKHLVLTALLFGSALPATGCIFVEDDDDDDGGGGGPYERGNYDTRLTATWELKSDTAAATCRPGSNSAATLYSCPGKAADCVNPSFQVFTDIGECLQTQSTGSMTVPFANDPNLALPPGEYTVWFEFSSNGSVYAKSFTETINLREGSPASVSFAVQIGHGFFDLAWTLVRGSAVVGCGDVPGLDGIALEVEPCVEASCTSLDPARAVASEFDCPPLEGRSKPMPFNGTFGFATATAAINAQGQNLADPTPKNTGAFEYGNQAHFLGTLMLEVP